MTPCIDAQGAAGQERLADKVYPVRLAGNDCVYQQCWLDTLGYLWLDKMN